MQRLLIIALAVLAANVVDCRRQRAAEVNFHSIASKNQCPRTISEPGNDESLQTHFDRQRVKLGLLEQKELDSAVFDLSTGTPETCTKKDVCLLMRQLDMDFFKRARAGTLTDFDFDNPPDLDWLRAGNCAIQTLTEHRGKRYKSVFDADACRKKAAKYVKTGRVLDVETINNNKYPSGCIMVKNMKRGSTAVFINEASNSVAVAGHRVSGGGQFDHAVDEDVRVLCEMDRSLSEASATYYSPYKLKPSMQERPAGSTSCSFGMYAYLAKLKETKSSCASILTYKTSGRFYSADEALKEASRLEATDAEGASEIRKYVEQVRQKFVLIDTVANKWCPGVWNSAMSSAGGTCGVSRDLPSDASASNAASRPTKKVTKKKGGGRMATVAGGPARSGNADTLLRINKLTLTFEQDDKLADLLAGDAVDSTISQASTGGKPAKLALSEDICHNLEDETLAEILEGVPTAPPDFFRDAFVPDGDEHPLL